MRCDTRGDSGCRVLVGVLEVELRDGRQKGGEEMKREEMKRLELKRFNKTATVENKEENTEIKIAMPDSAWAAAITIVFKNGEGGETMFTHGFNPHHNLKIEWEDNTRVRLKATSEVEG